MVRVVRAELTEPYAALLADGVLAEADEIKRAPQKAVPLANTIELINPAAREGGQHTEAPTNCGLVGTGTEGRRSNPDAVWQRIGELHAKRFRRRA